MHNPFASLIFGVLLATALPIRAADSVVLWRINSDNPGGSPIVEMYRNVVDPGENQPAVWYDSPDLRLPPYNINPAATHVLVMVKAKSVTYTWSDATCRGSLQVAVSSPQNTLPVNAVAHAFTLKPAGNYGQTDYALDYNTIPVGIQDGRFKAAYHAYSEGSAVLTLEFFLVAWGGP